MRRSISIGSNLGHVVKDVYYWEPKSLRIRTINWSYVFLAEYLPYAYGFSIAAVGVLLAYRLYMWRLDELMRIWSLLQDPLMMQVIGAAALIVAYASQHKSSIYCITTASWLLCVCLQVSREEVLTMMRAQGCFNDSSMEFQERILDNSGTGKQGSIQAFTRFFWRVASGGSVSIVIIREGVVCVFSMHANGKDMGKPTALTKLSIIGKLARIGQRFRIQWGR
ncbi:KCS9 [Symbiodinium necroappetens]|uniref:KCS9 protein n=1 Tax=Symbiodinium necroappetens TaxID=1628268 RepID=A0A812WE84_9DINO|nr:KCS9 [Symbiodinium necroappetens]